MKVIVAGYPKTGTKSMNAALTELGYNVYDALENCVLLEDQYTKIINEGWTTEDFRMMYENVDAVTDFPACFFWDEIHKAFPDAKIILTFREDEDENNWYRSFRVQLETQQNSFIRFIGAFSPTLRRISKNVTSRAFPILLGIQPLSNWSSRVQMNEQLAKKRYRSHNAYVMQCAPKDKLLIYKCSQGWQPLCEFLGLPVPSTPFPHKNIKGGIVKEMHEHPIIQDIRSEIRKRFAIYAVATGIVTYCSFKYGPVVMAQGGCNYFKSLFEKVYSF